MKSVRYRCGQSPPEVISPIGQRSLRWEDEETGFMYLGKEKYRLPRCYEKCGILGRVNRFGDALALLI